MPTPEESEEEQVLIASTHDIRYFTSLLRGVSFANRALVEVTEGGFVVKVEEARTLLGIAYIHSDVFDEFTYQSDQQGSTPSSQDSSDTPQTHFELQLNTLIECLNIFGTAGASSNPPPKRSHRSWKKPGEESDDLDVEEQRTNPSKNTGGVSKRLNQFFGSDKTTSLRMSYAGAGHPLTLLVAEDANGPTASCEVTTFDPEPILDLPFNGDRTLLKIILKSSWLLEALLELHPSCEKLTIIGHPPPAAGRAANSHAPRLRLKAVGTFGTTEMDYPNGKEVLESCECASHVVFTYRASHIIKTIRALQHSTKTSLRISEDGILSLQLIVPPPLPRPNMSATAFVEFRCLAIDESSQYLRDASCHAALISDDALELS